MKILVKGKKNNFNSCICIFWCSGNCDSFHTACWADCPPVRV
nr:hypothetical protein [Clostridium botulinum]